MRDIKQFLVVISSLLLVTRSCSFHHQPRTFHRSYAIIKGVRGGSAAEDLSNAAISSDCDDEIEINSTLTYTNHETDNVKTPIGELEDVHEYELEQEDKEEDFNEEDSIENGYNTLYDNINVDEEEEDLFEENDSDSTAIGIDNVDAKDEIEETESGDTSIMLSLTQDQEGEDAILSQEEAFPDVPTCTEDLNTDTETFIGDIGDELDGNGSYANSISVDNRKDPNCDDPESIFEVHSYNQYSNLIGVDHYDADLDSSGSILSDPILSPLEPPMDFASGEDENDANALDYKFEGKMEASSSEGNPFLSKEEHDKPYEVFNEDSEQDIQEDLSEGHHVDLPTQYLDDVVIEYSHDEDNEYDVHESSNDEASHELDPEEPNNPGNRIAIDTPDEVFNEGSEQDMQEDFSEKRHVDVDMQSKQLVDDAVIEYSHDENNQDDELNPEEPYYPDSHIGKPNEDLHGDGPYYQEFADETETLNDDSIDENNSMEPMVTSKANEEATDVDITSNITTPGLVEYMSRNQPGLIQNSLCTGDIETSQVYSDNKNMPPKLITKNDDGSPSDEQDDHTNTKLQDSFITIQMEDDDDSSNTGAIIHENRSEIMRETLSNNLDMSLGEIDLDNRRAERQDTIRNLGIDIEIDTDLDLGSDSTAFVDRMDLADAYDDDEKYSERTDDDGVVSAQEPPTDTTSPALKKSTTFLEKNQHIRFRSFKRDKSPLLDMILSIPEIKQSFLKKMQQRRHNASILETRQSFLNTIQGWRLPMPVRNETKVDAKALRALGYSSQEIKSMKREIKLVFAKKRFSKPRNGLPDEFFDTMEKEMKVFGMDSKVMRRVSVSTFAACIALVLQSTNKNATRNHAHAQEKSAFPDDLPIHFEARQEGSQSGLDSFVNFNNINSRYH